MEDAYLFIIFKNILHYPSFNLIEILVLKVIPLLYLLEIVLIL